MEIKDLENKATFKNWGVDEVVDFEKVKSLRTKVSEDTFYMTFIDYISPYFNLKSDNARKILVWMCNHAEWNTGKVSLTTALRTQMAEEIDICPNTITNNLKKLKDAKLINGEKGEFQINPQVFWKGELAVRRQMLKDKELQITFQFN
jgi:hypothetical protein